jgi:hypothetical protein
MYYGYWRVMYFEALRIGGLARPFINLALSPCHLLNCIFDTAIASRYFDCEEAGRR